MARKIAFRPPQKTIAILGEGETEYFYFTNLKASEKLNFKVKPEKPKHSSDLYSFEKKIERLITDDFDKIYVVLDLDRIVTNEAETIKYSKLRKMFNKKVIFIESMPCFEFWFLLHYQMTTRCFTCCKDTEKKLRKFIKDYEKTKLYFKKIEIYQLLKSNLEDAIKNSKLVNKEKLKFPENILHPKCDVFRIIEEITK